jgi:hypothetical protein
MEMLNLNIMLINSGSQARAHPNGGGCWAAAPLPITQNQNLKNTDFVDIMMSKLLHDFPVSQNQPLKTADD